MSLVVAVDHRFDDLEVERAILGRIGAEVLDARGLEREDVLDACAQADAVLAGARFRFDANAIERFERCRAIVRYGIGYDNVDVDAALAAGIRVAYVPDYCIEEVADHAIAMVLALNRHLFELDGLVRSGAWGVPAGLPVRRLSSCVLGIVGFGRIGQAVGVRAAALGMRVLAFDPVRPPAEISEAGATPSTFDELLQQSDYLTLHAPPLKGRALVGRLEFQRLKHGAMLINVGRAGLVDEAALVTALEDGSLGGAALDVTVQEPLVLPSPLVDVRNLILTPHAAWYSEEAVVDLRQKVAQEAARVLSGEEPRNAAR